MVSIPKVVSIARVSNWIDTLVGRAGARSGSKVRNQHRGCRRERSENGGNL
jgi:hypothetical protein